MAVNESSSSIMLKIKSSLDDSDVFFKELQGMKNRKYLTDFQIRVGQEEISCHKLVLAARSAYFQHLFNLNDVEEVKQGFVELKELHIRALQAVIEYCYTGTFEFKLDDAQHVIEVIEYLQMPTIKTKISSLIASHVSVDNSIDWYFFAGLFALTEVKEKAREVMDIDFVTVSYSPAFLAMRYDHFIEYITWEEIDHDCALDAACRWVQHDDQQRQDKFEEILQAIDLNNCSVSCLSYVVTAYGTSLLTSAKLKQKFMIAVRQFVKFLPVK